MPARTLYELRLGDVTYHLLTREKARKMLRDWLNTWGNCVFIEVRRDDRKPMSEPERRYFTNPS